MKKPSITDVAQASGVSIATVSRFINQSAGIKVSTGQRIMKAIHDLKYPLPEGFAVPVDKKNSNLILINIPTVANPFYNDVIKGIQDAAMRHGFYTLINVQHINPATADIFFKFLKSIPICGAVVLNALDQIYFEELNQIINFVQCCEYTEQQNTVSYVTIDDKAATMQMMQHLMNTGHQKIAFLSDSIRYKYVRNRKEGYLRTLQSRGIPIREDWIIELPELSFDLALSAVKSLMSAKEHPDAIFTVSDVFAAAAIRACRLLELHVPRDVIVSGFDNIEISRMTYPSITTINQPKYQLGYTAGELLIEKLHNPSLGARQILLNTELIIRESTNTIHRSRP